MVRQIHSGNKTSGGGVKHVEWHRSEPRDVRPFFQTERAEEALVSSGIPDSRAEKFPETKRSILMRQISKILEPTIFPELAATDAWMPKELANEIVLLIIVRQSFLKRSSIVGRYPVGATIPAEVALDKELLESLGGGRNLEIDRRSVWRMIGIRFQAGLSLGAIGLQRKSFSLKSFSKFSSPVYDLRTPRMSNGWPPGLSGQKRSCSATTRVEIPAKNRRVRIIR